MHNLPSQVDLMMTFSFVYLAVISRVSWQVRAQVCRPRPLWYPWHFPVIGPGLVIAAYFPSGTSSPYSCQDSRWILQQELRPLMGLWLVFGFIIWYILPLLSCVLFVTLLHLRTADQINEPFFVSCIWSILSESPSQYFCCSVAVSSF